MKVTSNEIAEKLGVSRSTVSRALNGYPHVDEALRKKIIQMAAEMGYRPNFAAVHLAKTQTIRLGVILYSKPQEYWNQILIGIRQAEDGLRDYGVSVECVITDISNSQEQFEALRCFAEKKVQGVILAPSNPIGMSDIIDELTSEGIPVLLLNCDIPESSRVCYVGSDYTRAGMLGGGLMGQFMGGRGKVAAITFDDPSAVISQKLTGFREEIGRYSEIELLGPFRFDRTGEHVYEDTLDMITAHRPDGIFMTYGQLEDVAQAVLDSGQAGRIILVGYDVSNQIISFLQRRVITAVVAQEPIQQGFSCVHMLYDLLARHKRPVCSSIHARLEVVMQQNSIYQTGDSMNVFSYFQKRMSLYGVMS